MDFITNTLSPVGGVIRLISMIMNITTPNQIKSKPRFSTIGTKMGAVRKMIAKP